MRYAAMLSLLILAGCTRTRISHSNPTMMLVGTNVVQSGGGWEVDRKTVLSKQAIGKMEAATGTNGMIKFGMTGYTSDSVQAVGVAVEAAVKAGIEGATGKK
jgi:hypothetical protein